MEKAYLSLSSHLARSLSPSLPRAGRCPTGWVPFQNGLGVVLRLVPLEQAVVVDLEHTHSGFSVGSKSAQLHGWKLQEEDVI